MICPFCGLPQTSSKRSSISECNCGPSLDGSGAGLYFPPLLETKAVYRGSRYHWIALFLGLAVILTVWSCCRYFFPDSVYACFPWFIWPAALLFIGLLLHIFYTRAKYFCLGDDMKSINWFWFHVFATIAVSIDLVISWYLLAPPDDRFLVLTWFGLVLMTQLLFVVEHFLFVFRPGDRISPQWAGYVVINVELYLVWRLTTKTLMWFIYPIAIWGTFLVVFTIVVVVLQGRRKQLDAAPKQWPVETSSRYVPFYQPTIQESINIPSSTSVISVINVGTPGSYSAFPTVPQAIRNGPKLMPTYHPIILSPINSPPS